MEKVLSCDNFLTLDHYLCALSYNKYYTYSVTNKMQITH